VETDHNPAWSNDSVKDFIQNQFDIDDFEIRGIYTALPQQLTHQHIKGYFVEVCFKEMPGMLGVENNFWMEAELMKKLAFPVFINQNIVNKKMRPAHF
jgi:hypothetical protein